MVTVKIMAKKILSHFVFIGVPFVHLGNNTNLIPCPTAREESKSPKMTRNAGEYTDIVVYLEGFVK
jgi:hypothetical protein